MLYVYSPSKKSFIQLKTTVALFCTILLLGTTSLAQSVRVELRYGEREFSLKDSTTKHMGKEIQFSTLRFYLSGFSLFYNDSMVWQETNSYHLIDAAQPESQTWELELPKDLTYNTMRFNIGIDSTTSCSGAMGGDLDPTKGMFWSWNSGYINFKLEGNYADCPSRNHQFEYHLGGYAHPYATLQQLMVAAAPDKPIDLHMDLARFLNGLNLEKEYRVMSPGLKAFEMAVKSREICTNALKK